MRHLSILYVFLLFSMGRSMAQVNDENIVAVNIPQLFQQINSSYGRLSFTNAGFKIYTNGGHLQGIQYYSHRGIEYIVMSGSSDRVAYYVMVDLQKGKLVRYNEIATSPFDHAGGFQIIGDFLVVGIEDNANKDASKIVFYNLSKPGESDLKPVHTINRGKEFKVKTAGALGIAKYKNIHLMAVASWDAATIDFYTSNKKPISDSAFEMRLAYTWKADAENRVGWSSADWNSYQGISLLAGQDGKLYLFAFARNGFNNVVDCFEVYELGETYTLMKVGSRYFRTGKNSFRYGTGIHLSAGGKLIFYSAPYNLRKKNTVNRYTPKED